MKRLHRTLFILCLAILSPGTAIAADQSGSTDPLIGTRPPEWQVDDWMNSDPESLWSLRGKVIFVRWWTAGCILCASSTESLNVLQERFSANDFFVTGFYHHKGSKPLDAGKVHDYARRFDFRFPIAIDHDWKTLNAWWLDGQYRDYTSVGFLLDRRGNIRYVHEGGRLTRFGNEFETITRLIEELIRQ